MRSSIFRFITQQRTFREVDLVCIILLESLRTEQGKCLASCLAISVKNGF